MVTRTQSLRVTNLIKSGITRSSIKRKLRKEKIKISTKEFNLKYKKFSTNPVLVKRFVNAKDKTKITDSYFKRLRNPKRALNNYVITIEIKVTNNKTGFSENTFISIGYDKAISKKKIIVMIKEAIDSFVKDSPNISAEFISIHSLYSKRGYF